MVTCAAVAVLPIQFHAAPDGACFRSTDSAIDMALLTELSLAGTPFHRKQRRTHLSVGTACFRTGGERARLALPHGLERARRAKDAPPHSSIILMLILFITT